MLNLVFCGQASPYAFVLQYAMGLLYSMQMKPSISTWRRWSTAIAGSSYSHENTQRCTSSSPMTREDMMRTYTVQEPHGYTVLQRDLHGTTQNALVQSTIQQQCMRRTASYSPPTGNRWSVFDMRPPKTQGVLKCAL